MRDHRKLKAFHLADNLAVAIYQVTAGFPAGERFGLTAQMRRAAVSIASNIVEGCARHSEADYLRFLDIAFASAKELEYQITLASRLEFMKAQDLNSLTNQALAVARVIAGLQNAIRNKKRAGTTS